MDGAPLLVASSRGREQLQNESLQYATEASRSRPCLEYGARGVRYNPIYLLPLRIHKTHRERHVPNPQINNTPNIRLESPSHSPPTQHTRIPTSPMTFPDIQPTQAELMNDNNISYPQPPPIVGPPTRTALLHAHHLKPALQHQPPESRPTSIMTAQKTKHPLLETEKLPVLLSFRAACCFPTTSVSDGGGVVVLQP